VIRQHVFQNTLKTARSVSGAGVHMGAMANVRLSPAPVNSGIVFLRGDVPAADARVPARADLVGATELGTTLRNDAGVEVATVEHLLAACAGVGVDNLIVAVNGPELPILDGSAAPWVEILLSAGLKTQGERRRYIRIRERIAVRLGAKSAALEPADASEFDVTIRYADPVIGTQRRVFVNTPASFVSEIAQARTFGFMADVGKLRAAGRGRGASLENTVVIEDQRVLNPEGLRFADEFVRHKILDAIGDFALIGAPILGRYVADQPGHALNAILVRALLDNTHAWTWEGESVKAAVEPLRVAAG
jgi:UDP-3-O-[3-hydroxymyristoyl] N-acetylglucosamine deacetylase